MLQQWALDICAHDSRNDICIEVLTNEPLTNKRKILTSFALLA
jgi:hypothetical protein